VNARAHRASPSRFGFRKERISLGRTAELCGKPLAAFTEFAATHEVPPIRYGETELEEDLRAPSDLGL